MSTRWVAGLLVALACAAAPPAGVEDAYVGGPELDVERLDALAGAFYDRRENRRFNSLATFQDPGLRQFFRTRETYSDYYAELAYELETTRFEASRPTQVEVETSIPGNRS